MGDVGADGRAVHEALPEAEPEDVLRATGDDRDGSALQDAGVDSEESKVAGGGDGAVSTKRFTGAISCALCGTHIDHRFERFACGSFEMHGTWGRYHDYVMHALVTVYDGKHLPRVISCASDVFAWFLRAVGAPDDGLLVYQGAHVRHDSAIPAGMLAIYCCAANATDTPDHWLARLEGWTA